MFFMERSTVSSPTGRAQHGGVVRIGVVVATLFATLIIAPPARPVAEALTSLVTFDVSTGRDSIAAGGPLAGDPITEFQFLINEDNVGDPFDDAADCEADDNGEFPVDWPQNCEWPSMQSFTAGAPIVTQGDQDDFLAGGLFENGIDLPEGDYLVSVTADGHKIGGAHFTTPLDGSGSATVPVRLDPYPLELVTVRARAYYDEITNGQLDLPPENGITDMSGFTVTVNDMAGEVTTDWFGNPICTEYEADVDGRTILDVDGDPTAIDGTGGRCVTDENGDAVIPNLGPNRYAVVVAPPPGTDWVQTTTLEGGLDWDVWAMEGYSGFDTEFNVGGESVPWVNFGYVLPRESAPNTPLYYTDPGTLGTNTITGVVARYDAYTPGAGATPNPGTIWGGFSGGVVTGPIEKPYIALLDLQDGDRTVYVGRGDMDGKFTIGGLRDGEYQLTLWDKDVSTILDLFQISVSGGEVVDTGVLGLTGWFANYEGHVFLDYNENGRRDPNEPGVPGVDVVLRNRENNVVELGETLQTTDPDGGYEFGVAYPFTMWTVMEAYNDRYTITGVTYQASNQPTETTVRGSGVDINILPIIGQTMRVDWGVRPYRAGENGSIAGTVFYDTTRAELDPRLAGVEDWAVGAPGVGVTVYEAVPSGDTWVKGDPIESTTSETWERPGPCTARDADGDPIPDQLAFPYDSGHCIEGPLTGIQVDPMEADGNFGASVNGNFGFGDLDPGKYIVEIDIPTDAYGRPTYKVEDETSVNVYAGDVYTPQNSTGGSPSAGAAPDPGGQMTTGLLPVEDPTTQGPGATGICVGAPHVVDISTNIPFADGSGTPFDGLSRAGCEAKLIEVVDGRSVAPGFTLYTDVPLPARMWGYTVDDLNIETDPRRTTFGEKAGISLSPTGVYDWSGRLFTHVNADPNGIWEVLLPSTTTMNCASPSGVCSNMYRFVGNDPGPVNAPFSNYNPNYRTIAANFQTYPGATTVADTAPTQVGASILGPGGQFDSLAVCTADVERPEIFRVNRPYARLTGGAAQTLTIRGNNFGSGDGEVRLVDPDSDAVMAVLPITSWNNFLIRVKVPAGTPGDAYQLEVVSATGQRPVNGLTYHVLNGGYNPRIVVVGPNRTLDTVQAGIDRFPNPGNRGVVVIVLPNTPSTTNLDGAYYENLVISTPVTVQGYGPGGIDSRGRAVHGTVLHGGNFWSAAIDPNDPTDFIEPNAEAWYERVQALTWPGNQNIADGEVVYVVAGLGESTFRSNRVGRLDGLKIIGGDQRDFPGNINQIGGAQNGGTGNVTTQGGGVFLNGYARYFRITNNLIQNNGGAYGGAIRVGTPFSGDNENDNVVIAHNQILSNGGSQLAGAVAIFNGADDYDVSDNVICGNSSTEYGGGISHFGYSPNGEIHHNEIVLNSAYDEGGGVTIAGELPADPSVLSVGAGPITIRSNVISSNLSNDDGGGVRFLQAGDYPFEVYNNVISNNVSTHQGGGIALNDAPNVAIVNNSIAGNVTTATALTSDGQPAPAGLSTTTHSQQLRATLPVGAPAFSDPEMFNNIFKDNRAGTWGGTSGVLGIGINGPGDIDLWDVGNTDTSGDPTISSSLVDNHLGWIDGGSNIVDADPQFVAPIDTKVEIYTWRTYQRFRSSAIVSYALGQDPVGDYHVAAGSPAVDAGAVGPTTDIDDDGRPTGLGWDIGADEISGVVNHQPVTDVLDDFERGTGTSNINDGLTPDWWDGQTATAHVRIQNASGDRVLRTWNPSTQVWIGDEPFADAQEAHVTFDTTAAASSTVGVVLRATGLNGNNRVTRASSFVEVASAPYLGGVVVRTKNAGRNALDLRAIISTGFGPGDSLLARINAEDDLEIYRQPAGGDWELLGVVELGTGSTAWPAAGTEPGGLIGLRSTLIVRQGRLDNFGGGSVR